MKKLFSALALLIAITNTPQAYCANLDEYVQDTVLLPVRTAAIVSALTVTSSKRAAKGAIETAREAVPNASPDTLVFEYAAVPFGFAAGALAGPFEGASDTINKAWEKPFSTESFQIEN